MDEPTRRQVNFNKLCARAFALFAGQHLLALEKQHPSIPGKNLIDAIWSEWLTQSRDTQGAYMRVALFPVAIIESAEMLGAHYRTRAIFQKCHPMANYLPDKLQELSIVPSMRWDEMHKLHSIEFN